MARSSDQPGRAQTDSLAEGHVVSLETLHDRYAAIAEGRLTGDSRLAYGALLERLGENRRLADAQGWTICTVERPSNGRLGLWGTPPGGQARIEVPDLRRGA